MFIYLHEFESDKFRLVSTDLVCDIHHECGKTGPTWDDLRSIEVLHTAKFDDIWAVDPASLSLNNLTYLINGAEISLGVYDNNMNWRFATEDNHQLVILGL